VNHETFDEPKQSADGMDTGQRKGYYEAFWSARLLRLKELLENEQSAALADERKLRQSS
jgi:hypothetical protein